MKQQILLTAALHSVLCDHMSVMSNKWRRVVLTAHRSCYSTRICGVRPRFNFIHDNLTAAVAWRFI